MTGFRIPASLYTVPETPAEAHFRRRLRGLRPKYERFYTPFGGGRPQRINLGPYSAQAKLFLGQRMRIKTRKERHGRKP